jgi:hypothetical protein
MQKQLMHSPGDTFSNMEFFKATYFAVKLDKEKMRRIFQQKDMASAA